ncbi:hypothetical protein HU200_061185 [Digitaria exilis]|uniref:Uncharacterized protein n=1 Tax=Digitaria exilis TaxID=1010633 RepID=A0A835E0Z0_9POAL|nr:hypothetical protein HU200_061185 [Digitaria exilis]
MSPVSMLIIVIKLIRIKPSQTLPSDVDLPWLYGMIYTFVSYNVMMVCLVRWFHGGVVKENGEFENMKNVTRMFEVAPCLHEIVECAWSHFSCGVDDEISLKGGVDCDRGRAAYALVYLKTDVEWDQFKRLVEQSSVPYLDVVVTSRKTADREGESADDSGSETFSSDETEPGTTHDYFPNDVFEREEAEEDDDDDISKGSDGGDDNDGYESEGEEDWPFADFMPPYAYVWNNTEVVRGPPRRRYTAYTNKIDCLAGNQVCKDEELLRIVNDAGVAMRHSNDARFLQSFVEPTPIHSAPGGSSAMASPSSSHRAGKAPASPQASDEDMPRDDSEDSPALGTRTAMHNLGDAVGVTARTFPAVPIAYRLGEPYIHVYIHVECRVECRTQPQQSKEPKTSGRLLYRARRSGVTWTSGRLLCHARPPGAAKDYCRTSRSGAVGLTRQAVRRGRLDAQDTLCRAGPLARQPCRA